LISKNKKANLIAVTGILLLLLQTASQRFGFEKGGMFSNYVYDSPVYLMLPAVLILFFCTAMHIRLRSEKFEREMGLHPPSLI
jgi:hypothetical protein